MLSPELIAKIRQIEIRSKRLVQDSFAGEYHAIFKGRGMEFDEVRPYQFGDEVRTIDWNVTARMGAPYVKRYIEERELTVLLLVDASGSSDFGSVGQFKRELAAEIAAVISFAATNNNDKIGLLIFTDQVEEVVLPRKGRKHVLRMVRDLLAFEPQGRGTDLKLALDTANQILKRRCILFLISDFLTAPESYEKLLYISNRRHDVIAVDLHDPLEAELPSVGVIAVEDAETGQIHWVDTSSRAWREQFAQRVRDLNQSKLELFRRAKVDHIPINTQQDYVTALTKFFQRRLARLGRG